MRTRTWTLSLMLLCFAVLVVAAPVFAQQGAAPVVVTPDFAKAVTPANLPPCVKGVVLEGNPRTGPYVSLSRAAAGCRIPPHWHSTNERVMWIRGEGTIEIQGGKPEALRSGSFYFIPSHQIHQSAVTTECEFFLSRDGAADIHYVGPDGNEISFEQAMAALKKPAAKKPSDKKAGAKPY